MPFDYAGWNEALEKHLDRGAGEMSKDGGPAFPVNVAAGPSGDVYVSADSGGEGMSLRDWFAGMAMQGWLASWPNDSSISGKEDSIAKAAYEQADAMLKEREKGDE